MDVPHDERAAPARARARRAAGALAIAFLLAGPAWAQKKAEAAPADPAWTALEREFGVAWQAHQSTLAELQQQGVEQSKWPSGPAAEYWDRCQAFADRGETGAIRWCVAYSEALGLAPAEKVQFRRELYGKWAKDLPEGPGLKDLLRALNGEARPDRMGLATTSELFERIAARVKDKTLRAEARASRALAHLGAGGPANQKIAREAIALANEDDPKADTLVRVRGRLFQLDNLQIGMTCPDFTAKDVDGVEFKLSDYRGKVVVLDFWGFW